MIVGGEACTVWTQDNRLRCVIRPAGGILSARQVEFLIQCVATGLVIRGLDLDDAQRLPRETDPGFIELLPAVPTCNMERWKDH